MARANTFDTRSATKRANVHGSAHRPDQRSSQNKTDQKCSATKVAHVPLWRLKHRRMALATVNAARRSLWPNQCVAWIKDMLGMVGHTSTLTQPFQSTHQQRGSNTRVSHGHNAQIGSTSNAKCRTTAAEHLEIQGACKSSHKENIEPSRSSKR